MRYFTVKAAEALIPDLEEIFSRGLELQAKAEAKAKALQEIDEQGERAPEAAILRGQLHFLVNAVNAELGKIHNLGAIAKGLDPALVDFPHRLEGKEVYLCWQRGETKITQYHGLEGGFAGRKPLPQQKAA